MSLEPPDLVAYGPEQAESIMCSVYDDLSVRAGAEMSLSVRVFDVPAVKLVDLDISRSSITTCPYPFYTVAIARSGRADLTIGRGEARNIPNGGGIPIAPGPPVRVDYRDESCQIATVVVDQAALDNDLVTMLGRTFKTPIKFGTARDASTTELFQRTVDALRAYSGATGGPGCHPALARSISQVLTTSLLMGYHHNYSDELERSAPRHGPKALRRAVAEIEDDPEGIAGIVDLARRAGLSVRALEDSFRRHLDTTPMRYLRKVRLARAHADLLGSDPETTTATTIAQQWGFGHYGRFASEYRRAYGRNPATTLRARR